MLKFKSNRNKMHAVQTNGKKIMKKINLIHIIEGKQKRKKKK